MSGGSVSERPSLNRYLESCKVRNRGAYILGNESADLDSVACSISLAYATGSHAIINIPRCDLRLRGDVVWILRIAGLSSSGSELTCIDDEFIAESVVLVDHNELSCLQKELAGVVTGVIDHHVDGGEFLDAKPRIIERVGSCATLVTEYIGEDIVGMDCGVAVLLLGALLLDTHNMDERVGKGTERDGKAIERLEGIAEGAVRDKMMVKEGRGWRDVFYKWLKRERKNVSDLSLSELLRKDFKVVSGDDEGKIGIGSVCVSVKELRRRGREEGGIVECLDKLREQVGIDGVMVLASFEGDDGFCREICVSGKEDGLGMKVLKGLREWDGGERLKVGECMSEDGIVWCRQGNLRASRKVVAPIVARLISALYKSC